MAGEYFRVNLLLLRLAGVPLKVQRVSLLHSVYNEVTAVSFHCTFVATVLHLIMAQEELAESMKNVRILVGTAILAVMHVYLRYEHYIHICTNMHKHVRFSGFHGPDYEEWRHLGCYAV
jgi:hypothetical protein